MAYLDAFEHDVFLSYDPIDDRALPEDQGWVSAFGERLQIALDQYVGGAQPVKIWRDLDSVDGGQLADRATKDALGTSAILVVLISNGYLQSEQCRKQLNYFYHQAVDSRFGLTIGTRPRIVKVLLANISSREMPDKLLGPDGFRFHETERDNQIGSRSEPGSPRFQEQLSTLAAALYKLLKALKESPWPSRAPTVSSKGTVHIADVTDSLRAQVRTLEVDLERKGIEVVTGVPPPFDAVGHDDQVDEMLKKTDLSVHLFDTFAGRDIDGRKGVTYSQRQLELAGKHDCSRVIWLPRALDLATIEDSEHRDFLQSLERGDARVGSYDFIRGVRADLVRQIQDKIEWRRPMPEDEPLSLELDRACLLVTHAKDTAHTLPVAGTLKGEGFEPVINHEVNEPNLMLKVFEDRLRQVASLIVFYGDVRREWVRERLDLAIKVGISEKLNFRLAVFAAPPEKLPEETNFSQGFVRIETLASADQVLAFAGRT